MHWNGKELTTINEIADAIQAITKSGSKNDALAFKQAYTMSKPCGGEDIGYLSGYFDKDLAQKTLQLFEVEHPVLGKELSSPKEAFKAGFAAGRTTERC